MRQIQKSNWSLIVLTVLAGLGVTQAAHADCPGDGNTCLGSNALSSNTTGTSNTAIGAETIANIDWVSFSGSANTATGAYALFGLNGNRTMNSAHGYFALAGHWNDDFSSNNGDYNTASGAYALRGLDTGNYNTASGFQALGGDNVYFDSLCCGPIPVGVDGSNNTASGAFALRNTTTGNNNTASGYRALHGGTTGLTGANNTASGARALAKNTTGTGNTALGYDSLRLNTTGSRNTATGVTALHGVTTGIRNTSLGAGAGKDITTGNDNVVIGAENAGVPSDNGVIRIGTSAFQKKTFIAGVRGVQTGLATATSVFIDANGQLGTIKSSRAVKEDIQSMGNVSERLLGLRPVTFRYKEAHEDGAKPIQYGLIAEEVAEAFPELVVNDEVGKPETVAYHLLPTLLLNELQKAQRVNQQQTEQLAIQAAQLAEVAELKRQMDEMKALLAALQSKSQEVQVVMR